MPCAEQQLGNEDAKCVVARMVKGVQMVKRQNNGGLTDDLYKEQDIKDLAKSVLQAETFGTNIPIKLLMDN